MLVGITRFDSWAAFDAARCLVCGLCRLTVVLIDRRCPLFGCVPWRCQALVAVSMYHLSHVSGVHAWQSGLLHPCSPVSHQQAHSLSSLKLSLTSNFKRAHRGSYAVVIPAAESSRDFLHVTPSMSLQLTIMLCKHVRPSPLCRQFEGGVDSHVTLSLRG